MTGNWIKDPETGPTRRARLTRWAEARNRQVTTLQANVREHLARVGHGIDGRVRRERNRLVGEHNAARVERLVGQPHARRFGDGGGFDDRFDERIEAEHQRLETERVEDTEAQPPPW